MEELKQADGWLLKGLSGLVNMLAQRIEINPRFNHVKLLDAEIERLKAIREKIQP